MWQSPPVPRLLIVHHTPSPAMHTLVSALQEGATTPELGGKVEVVSRPALVAAAVDVLEADAVALATPANLGYMSGALKHFFDVIYYPCLDAKAGMPFGLVVHGNDDVTGAVRGIERIVTGLRWRAAGAFVEAVGTPDPDTVAASWELGAVLAAGMLDD
jgi:multimeric flavodoxin WrbA